jgi:hypothetical protein
LSKRIKISLAALIFLIAVVVLLHFQAKRIIIELIEANSSERVSVKIGRMKILPHKSSISLQDVVLVVKEQESDGFKKTTIRKVFLDVASLWDFFEGGTLVIENLACEGGEITIYKGTKVKTDTVHISFDLGTMFQKLKKDAIRFNIQEMTFLDFSLTLRSDSSHSPTEIKHLGFRAYNLFLSADSVLKKKPLVEFFLPGQTIELPTGISVGFDSLFFSTTDNSIQVDDLDLTMSADSSTNQYKIHSEKVRLSHFDFESLYTKGIAIIDSVFLGRSDLSVSWLLHAKDSIGKGPGVGSIPKLNVKHLNIAALAADIKLRKGSIENRFKVDNSFVTIQDLWHKPDSTQKLSIRDFDVVLAKYNTFLSKENTSISFDTVRLQKHSLSLLNFKIQLGDQKLPVLATSVFELKQLDWYTLLVYKKLVAEQAIVLNPTVHTTIKPRSSSEAESKNLIVLNSLNDFLDVQLFTLRNATAYLKLMEQHADITLQGGNATIHFDDMIKSKNPNEALHSLDNLSFNTLRFDSEDLSARMDKFTMRDGSSSVGNVSVKSSEALKLSSGNLSVGKIYWDQLQHNLALSDVGWKSLELDISGGSQRQHSNTKKSKLPSISVEKLRGENTQVNFTNHDLRIGTLLQQLNLEKLELGDSIRITGVDIKGSHSHFQSELNSGSINSFSVNDQGGALNDILFSRPHDSLLTSIGQINFQADVPALAQKNYTVASIAFKDMKSSYSKHDSLQNFQVSLENDLVVNDINYHEKKLTIGSLMLETDQLNFIHNKKISKREEADLPTPKGYLKNLKAGIDSIFYNNESTNYKIAQAVAPEKSDDLYSKDDTLSSIQSTVLKGGINLSLSQIETSAQDSSTTVRAKVNSVKFDHVNMTQNKLSAQIATGSVNDLVIHSGHFRAPWEMIRDNYATAGINNLKARIETGEQFIQFDRLDYDAKLTRGQIQNIEFRPLKNKQEVLDESFYQTNFIHTRIPSISIQNFYAQELANDSVIHIGSIHVNAPDLDIHRDKNHPFFSNKIKLLPTNTIQKLGVKFKIDTMRIGEGKILYTEKSQITGREGSIHFTKLNGLVRNVRNIGLKNQDSLFISASARFLDSAKVNIQVKESYHDSLAGFDMITRVSPFHTSILNPALIPMVSVKFESGFVDTLHMRAIGREYISLGSMKFLYHNLNVNFLNKDDTAKHSVKNVILKFAANNFVIRTNNTRRVGKVFFERDRYRAVFQYWIKMILSGVTTSVGAKSNKKQIKKYMKDLNQKKLPPIMESPSSL